MRTKNTFISLTIFVFVIICHSGFAQNTPDKIVEAFFSDYQKKGASKALDNLYATNEWMTKSTDAITSLKSQLEGLDNDLVGKYYGYELIVEKKLSGSYVLQSYLVKFDRQPVRYTFQFYKPDDKWKVYSFKFDSNLDDEIEEAAKLYFSDLN